jgi:hypothetical protein
LIHRMAVVVKFNILMPFGRTLTKRHPAVLCGCEKRRDASGALEELLKNTGNKVLSSKGESPVWSAAMLKG